MNGRRKEQVFELQIKGRIEIFKSSYHMGGYNQNDMEETWKQWWKCKGWGRIDLNRENGLLKAAPMVEKV